MNPLSLSQSSSVGHSAGPVRVLLVEDNPGDAKLVRYALAESSDFELFHQATLNGALDWLGKELCNVILLDLGLPDSLGFETITKMRLAAASLPIIVLTGHDDPDFAVMALEAGAQDYLVKGDFTGGSLLRALRYAIARKQMEDRVRQAERQLRIIFSVAPEAILLADDSGRVTLANPAAETMFGLDGSSLLQANISDLVPQMGLMLADAKACQDGVRGEGEGLRAAEPFHAAFSINPGIIEEPPSHLVLVQDVTDRKKAEEELRRLVVTDPLTGLANRRRFEEACEIETMRFRRYGVPASLLMLDIDYFKKVNDTYGHATGDAVLVALAETCRRALRETDVAARLGGEEFAILLPMTGETGALEIAERLRVRLAATSVALPDGRMNFTVSLGVATFAGQDEAETVLARADAALYSAKDLGRNRVEVAAPPPIIVD
ncbi:MAG TPA: diguanylate cyclase [Candidatus Sulfotelmatobacter sp.]|nr:diguanylate cyclase [Candidatus Sulfotelmatobacter sp.]